MSNIPEFLKHDATTCTIKRYAEGSRNDLGEPARTLNTVSTNVVCSLDRSMSASRKYAGGREMSTQGVSDLLTFRLITLSDQDILAGDMVVVAGVNYEVISVTLYSSHKEAELVKK